MVNENPAQFLPRDAMLARYMLSLCVCLSVRPSVCLSVCLSVTNRYCIETSGRIEVVFSMESSFRLFYTIRKSGISKNKGILSKI